MTDSLYQVIQDLFAEMLGNVHTATVARVVKVNEKTLDVQPVINRVVDGESVKLPVFVEVPPVTLQGGGSYVALPVAVDDYCLLIFTERCFDRWYQGKDEQPPAEMRMHDYSDGFAIVGVNPLQAAISLPSIIRIEGAVEAVGDWKIDGRLTVTGAIVCEDSISAGGDILADGDVTGTDCKTTEGVSLGNHLHPTTAPGANTGAPIPTGGG
jgi:hypothetical protein